MSSTHNENGKDNSSGSNPASNRRGPAIKTLGQGRYRVIKLAGRGGMSAVYHAYDTANDRDVAIKVLSLDLATEESFLARFQRESELMRDLNHPHILRAYDYGQEDEIVYLVMSYYGGGTLKSRMGQKPLPLVKIADYLSQVASGLGYAHARGIIHRDIKPSNVLVHHASENLVLSDFGIAKALSGASLARTGTIMGTPLYMSPEQFLATGDQRSDIYALGVVLYQMLTGEVPFKGEGIGFKHMSEPVPPLQTFGFEYDPAIEAVVMKALAKQPEGRYQKVGEMAEAFSEALHHNAQNATQQAFLNQPAIETMQDENSPIYTPWEIISHPEDHQALAAQDALLAIPPISPPNQKMLLPNEQVQSAATLGPNNNPVFDPDGVASASNPAADINNKLKQPAPAPNPAVQTTATNLNTNSRPYLPLIAASPGHEPHFKPKTVALPANRKSGLKPLLGLLAGFILVLLLGGGALLLFLNFFKAEPPTIPTAPPLPNTLVPGATPATSPTNSPSKTTTASTPVALAQNSPVVGAPLPRLRMVFTSNAGNDKQNILFYDPLSGVIKALSDSNRDSLPEWSDNRFPAQARRWRL